MGEDLFYTMNKSKLGIAVIINNLDHEQTPTRRDVEVMGKVLIIKIYYVLKQVQQ